MVHRGYLSLLRSYVLASAHRKIYSRCRHWINFLPEPLLQRSRQFNLFPIVLISDLLPSLHFRMDLCEHRYDVKRDAIYKWQ